MLLLLTALLTASTLLSSPVEAVGVPGFGEISAVTSSTEAADAAICEVELPGEWERLRGLPLLEQIGAADRAAVADFGATHSELVTGLLDDQPTSTAVARWWDRLDQHSQEALRTGLPELVGNLEGVPYSVRDQANREHLAQVAVQAERERSSAGRTEAVRLDHRIEALAEIRKALGPDNAEPHRSLVTFRAGDQPTAAVALGDLDRADYVSYLVPGMFFGVRTQLVAWTDTAARLYDEQRSWLQVLSTADESARQQRVATVAWIGYQTPDLLNVGSLDLARAGRDALAGSLAGLSAVRGDDRPFVSLLAHSYGSTAALMTVGETDTAVDALALVGSPGSAAASVDQLRVRAGNVFVGEAGWDPIPNSSFFGSDPGAAEYGARIMSVAGGVDVITNEVLAASSGHNAYFDQGSESLRNLALIGIDRGELVTDGSSRDADRTLALVTGPKV